MQATSSQFCRGTVITPLPSPAAASGTWGLSLQTSMGWGCHTKEIKTWGFNLFLQIEGDPPITPIMLGRMKIMKGLFTNNHRWSGFFLGGSSLKGLSWRPWHFHITEPLALCRASGNFSTLWGDKSKSIFFVGVEGAGASAWGNLPSDEKSHLHHRKNDLPVLSQDTWFSVSSCSSSLQLQPRVLLLQTRCMNCLFLSAEIPSGPNPVCASAALVQSWSNSPMIDQSCFSDASPEAPGIAVDWSLNVTETSETWWSMWLIHSKNIE